MQKRFHFYLYYAFCNLGSRFKRRPEFIVARRSACIFAQREATAHTARQGEMTVHIILICTNNKIEFSVLVLLLSKPLNYSLTSFLVSNVTKLPVNKEVVPCRSVLKGLADLCHSRFTLVSTKYSTTSKKADGEIAQMPQCSCQLRVGPNFYNNSLMVCDQYLYV